VTGVMALRSNGPAGKAVVHRVEYLLEFDHAG
jgi:hypothetical protein